jgi:hypothetical protein
VIRIDVHPAGENPINTTRTLLMPVHVRPAYASYGCSSYVQPFIQSPTDLNRSIAPKKKGSRHNPQHVGRPIHGFVPSFSPTTANGATMKSQASVDNRLLGLPDPYHRHAIGTFNTCSQVSTSRSLTDTGGGYHIENLKIATALSSPFPSEGSTDPPNGPARAQIFQH